MPNLTPVSSFDNVPELETTTLALGGPGGPMNLPAQALLNRTQWLKDNAVASTAGPYAAAAGTANAITAAFTPPITSMADGLKLRILAAATNTGAATFAPDALMAQPIVGGAYAALQGGEILANGEVELTWNSALSSWVITTQAGGSPQVPDAAQSKQAASKGQVDQVIADLASSVAGKGASLVYDAAKASDLASSAAGKGADMVQVDATFSLRGWIANLLTSAGAALVGFIQTGAGAISTTVQKKLGRQLELFDFVNPSNWAAAQGGTFDLSPALGAAIDEALVRGADTVCLPSGLLLLNTKVTKSLTGLQGLAIEGKGMGLTQLICADPTGYGLEFNCAAQNWWIDVSPSNAFRFANFSICSTALNLGTGLKINGGSLEGRVRPACVFDHVEFRAKDSINNQAFLTALWLNDCGGTYFEGCRWLNGGTSNITPTSVKISSTDATTDPTSFLFDGCEWYYGGKGIVCGDNPEGIHLANCVMVKVDRGVEWICAAESGLSVVGGHFNCLSYNFYLDGVFDTTITGVISFLSGGTPQDHIYYANGSSATITGNMFYTGNNGVNVGTLPAGNRGVFIGNNQFSATTTGINLSGAANNVTVGPNGFTGVTNRVVGAGGAGSFIQKRSWSISTVPTLVGGAAFETINVAVPTNTFLAKPTVVVATAEGSSADYVCSYNSSTSTATSIQLRIVRRDGGTITAGAARFNIVAYE